MEGGKAKYLITYHFKTRLGMRASPPFAKGGQGGLSIIPATLTQLQWWLKNGDLSRPLQTDYLPYAGLKMSQKIWWTQDANPETFTFDQILYQIRSSEGGELVLDRVTLDAIYEDSDGVMAFDALVTPYMQLERKMNVLQGLMNRASPSVQIVAQQISQPFMQRGTANVAVVWELSDGQTISVFLHNPDVTPKKIAPTDELISWKWLLNKKDITLVVAPEHGEDLNPREVAKRIMRLADKNGAAFARANAKRADTMQTIDGLKTEIASLEGELATKQNKLEAAKVEAESKPPVDPQKNVVVSLLSLSPAWVYTPQNKTISNGDFFFSTDGSINNIVLRQNTENGPVVFKTFDGRGKTFDQMAKEIDDAVNQAVAAAADGKPVVADVAGINPSVKQAAEETPPVVLTGKELGDFPDTEEGKKALRQAAKLRFDAMLGEWVPCPALGGDVEIRKSGIRKTLSLSGDPRKLKLIAALPSLIETGKELGSKPTYAPEVEISIVGYHYMRSVANLEGQDIAVRFVVKEDDKGKYHWDHTVHAPDAILDSAKENGPDRSSPSLTATSCGGAGRTGASHLVSGQLNHSIAKDNEGMGTALGGSGGAMDSAGAADLGLPVLLPFEPSTGQRRPINSIANILDSSIGSGMVFNLFIEGEEPEVVPDEEPTDPQKAADRSLFQSVIDGTVPNIMDPALGDLLVTAYERNESDTDLMAIAEKALNAYEAAVTKAAQKQLAGGAAVTTDAIPPDATAAALATLAPYIGQAQLTAITQGVIGDEQEFYQAKVAQLAQLINTMPEMPWLEGKGETSLAYLHYFDDNGDWYITERDRQATQTQAFGLANPDGTIGAMGNIDISQLTGEGAELDLDWEPVMVETVNGFPVGQESTPIQLDGVPKIPPCPPFAKGGVLDGINTVQGPSGNPECAADQALFNAILAGDLTGTLDQGVAERLEAAWYRSAGDDAMMALGTQAMAAYAAANGQAGRSLKAGQVVDDSSTIVPDRLVIAKGIEDEDGIAKPDSQTDPDIKGNGTDSKGVKPGDNAKFDDAKPVDPADAANQDGKLDPDKSPDGQEAPDVKENAKNDGDQAKDDGNGEVANDVGKKFDSAEGLPAIYPDSRPTPPDSPAVGSEQVASEIAVTKASQKKGEEWVGRPEYGRMFDAGDPTSPKIIPPGPPLEKGGDNNAPTLVKGEVLDSAGLGAALGNELGVNWMFDVGLTWIDRPAYSGMKGSDDPPSEEVGKTTEGDEDKEAKAVDEGEKQAELPKGDASTSPVLKGVELDSVVLDGANDMHWITTKTGTHLLIQGNPKKGFKVRSGGGGKFNGQKWKPTKLTKALPAKPYHEMTRQEFHEAHENMPVKREGHQTRKEALDAKHLSHIHEAAKSGKAIPGHVVEDMMKRAIA